MGKCLISLVSGTLGDEVLIAYNLLNHQRLLVAGDRFGHYLAVELR